MKSILIQVTKEIPFLNKIQTDNDYAVCFNLR